MSDEIKTCDHIKANGTLCKSPALTGDDYCYFHTAQRHRIRRQRRAERRSFMYKIEFPLLEDPESIQIAIGDVLNALVSGRLEHKTAGLLLYGLQTAASNIRQTSFEVGDEDEFFTEYREKEAELLESEIQADIEADKQRDREEIAQMQQHRDRVIAERAAAARAEADRQETAREEAARAATPLPTKKPPKSAPTPEAPAPATSKAASAQNKNGAKSAVTLNPK